MEKLILLILVTPWRLTIQTDQWPIRTQCWPPLTRSITVGEKLTVPWKHNPKLARVHMWQGVSSKERSQLCQAREARLTQKQTTLALWRCTSLKTITSTLATRRTETRIQCLGSQKQRASPKAYNNHYLGKGLTKVSLLQLKTTRKMKPFLLTPRDPLQVLRAPGQLQGTINSPLLEPSLVTIKREIQRSL